MPISVRKHITVVSALLNELGGVTNPFNGYTKPNNESSRDNLNKEELITFSTVELTDQGELDARDAFLFSFSGRGIRAFDLLTMQRDYINSDRLVYQTDKSTTKAQPKTLKILNIRITAAMAKILHRHRSRGEPYIFPYVVPVPKMYGTIKKRYKERVNRAAWRVNTNMKGIAIKAGIEKNVHLHVARHTFS